MAREAKFNPVDEHLLSTSSKNNKEYVTISPKYGTMALSLAYVDRKKMKGRFIKLKADIQKKAIFWKVIDGDTNMSEMKSARQVSVYDSAGARTCTMSIRKILNHMNIKEEEDTFKNLPIKKYNTSFLEDEYEYVELKHLVNKE